MNWETIETKLGHTLQITQDQHAGDPRKEWDNLGTMACFHNRYNLGDKHDLSIETIKLISTSTAHISLPLYLYEHSGITMRTKPFPCPWDSGQVGIIFVSRARIRDEWKVKAISPKLHKQILSNLQGEVNEYDHYLTGNVYGYRIIDSTGNEINSCWGFYGHDSVKEEGNMQLEYFTRNIDPRLHGSL